jgi:hypothetical protein
VAAIRNGAGGAGRPEATRPAAHDRPRQDRDRDIEASADEAGSHALVDAALGGAVEGRAFTVAEAWRDYGIKPWRSESFRFSTDPELEAKVIDIVGLYLAPPENAIVLCVDEKFQIQRSTPARSG